MAAEGIQSRLHDTPYKVFRCFDRYRQLGAARAVGGKLLQIAPPCEAGQSGSPREWRAKRLVRRRGLPIEGRPTEPHCSQRKRAPATRRPRMRGDLPSIVRLWPQLAQVTSS
jgi:hypothetical protein